MADEFIKGLSGFAIGSLGWLIVAGWYNTPTFEAKQHPQLLAPAPTNVGVYGEFALVLKEVLFWFALGSAFMFWVILPAVSKLRGS